MRYLCLLIISFMLVGCMIAPFDQQEYASPDTRITFSGYGTEGAAIQIRAMDPRNGQWVEIGNTTSRTGSSDLKMGDTELYSWSTTLKVPQKFWIYESQIKRYSAKVKATSGTGNLVSVRSDYGSCYQRNTTIGDFQENCTSENTPVANIYARESANDLGEQIVVTSEDFTGFGTSTAVKDLNNVERTNFRFAFQDIIGFEEFEGRKMYIDLSDLSSIAPDCDAISKSMRLKGTTTCVEAGGVNGSGNIKIPGVGGKSNQSCKEESRDIYGTREVCEVITEPCGPGHPKFSGDDIAGLRPNCPKPTRVCYDQRYVVRTVKENVCRETVHEVEFLTESWESISNTKIESLVYVQDHKVYERKTVNGGRASYKLKPQTFIPRMLNPVESTFYFKLTCRGRALGSAFNDFDDLNSEPMIFDLIDVQETCEDSDIFLRSNRTIVFEKGTLVIQVDSFL